MMRDDPDEATHRACGEVARFSNAHLLKENSVLLERVWATRTRESATLASDCA
jgi:hypothetical protein